MIAPPVFVLAIASIIASPALWMAFVEGTMPIDVALSRLLLLILAGWALSWLARQLVPPPAPRRVTADDPNP